ncbi:2-hydroxyacyl-CoA dehydratase family protein [Anaerohalosphaera lusitana]|uniref:2-hydroxyacyl-CoA dehydratase family protein n=1 Tax=Anaerohalosphaera lusitana TaxID=1936003 RepID=UPI001F1DB4E6|nr:2-hydroxyacyl-CoA dehydratase family protein [Anaerohalosphaera lusitana]
MVGYTSGYVPVELIEAAGHEAKFVRPSMAGGAECLRLREGMCPYAAGTVASLLGRDDLDAFVGAGTCDQVRRCFEAMRDEFGGEMFVLNVPVTRGTASQGMFGAEVERLERFLKELKDSTNDDEVLEDGRDEQRTRFEDGSGELVLGVIGAPIAAEGLMLGEIAGARLVDMMGPVRLGEFGGCESDMDGLVRKYFVEVLDIRQRSNAGWYEWLREWSGSGAVDGLILHRYTWCDLWHGELGRIKEAAGVAVIDLEINEAGSYASANTVTRLNAFGEMLS